MKKKQKRPERAPAKKRTRTHKKSSARDLSDSGAPASAGKGTRAKKFDNIKREQYLSLLSAGANKTGAAELVGVCRNTVRNRRIADDDFKERESRAEMASVARVESFLFRQASEGNVTAAIFFLKNRAPDRWRDRREHEISGNLVPKLVPIDSGLLMEGYELDSEPGDEPQVEH